MLNQSVFRSFLSLTVILLCKYLWTKIITHWAHNAKNLKVWHLWLWNQTMLHTLCLAHSDNNTHSHTILIVCKYVCLSHLFFYLVKKYKISLVVRTHLLIFLAPIHVFYHVLLRGILILETHLENLKNSVADLSQLSTWFVISIALLN